MAKKAVLVGCNYPGTNNELKGCVNDVIGMYRMLMEKFGFADENVVVLVDTNSNYPMPTGTNIKGALYSMVQGAQPGDTFFFHFSGHGTRIPVDAGEVDDTGFDECICPSDLNLIEDDDFRELISKLPAGATFTIVSDSCQSGGLIDGVKEQIGNSFEQLTMAEVAPDPAASTPNGGGEQKIVKRELSTEAMVQMLREKSGRDNIDVSNIRSSVWELFGDQASLKVKKQVQGISNTSRSVSVPQPAAQKQGKVGKKSKVFLKKKKKNDSSSSSSDEDEDEETANTYHKKSRNINVEIADEEDGDEEGDDDEEGDGDEEGDDEEEGDGDEEGDDEEEGDGDDEEREIDEDTYATYAHVEPLSGVDGNVGVLVSGCQSHQTSADVRAEPPHGALTNGIITVLQMLEPGEPISNRQLVTRIRRYLASKGLTQEPGLYCSDEKADEPFICVPVN